MPEIPEWIQDPLFRELAEGFEWVSCENCGEPFPLTDDPAEIVCETCWNKACEER